MAKEQLRRANPRGNQFLQPQRGRRQSPRKLGHEGDAGLLDALAELPGLGRIVNVERRAAVDALAMIARREHRQRAIPFRGKDQDDIDVFAGRQRPKAIDFAAEKSRAACWARCATSQHTARTSKRSDKARSAGRCRVSQASPSPTMPTRSFILNGRPVAQKVAIELTGRRESPRNDYIGCRRPMSCYHRGCGVAQSARRQTDVGIVTAPQSFPILPASR